jgi:two-component system cell cycle response regulator
MRGRDSVVSDPADVGTITAAELPGLGDAQSGERVHGVLQVLAGPHSGAIFPIDQDVVLLGRASNCQVHLTDQGISRVHARIVRLGNECHIEDVDSRNGTFCQRERVVARRKLEDGDRISIGGETVIRFGLLDKLERQAARQTLDLMNRDPLTQLLNRRHFDEQLCTELAYAQRHRTALHLIFVDLDHFKRINDRYGHDTGDAMLRAVARCIENTVRIEDLVGRYGGEEFVIGVRGVERSGATALAERVRTLIEQVAILHGTEAVRITASVGMAELNAGIADTTELLAAADRAMYRAKEQGRNRVVFA